MRALVCDGSGVKFKSYQPEPAAPGPDEALLQVQLAGVCQTDFEIARGYMGFKGILGHEFVGTVTKCADRKWQGKRVVSEINCVCLKCDMCQSGLSAHCRNRTVVGIQGRDGAFAEQVVVPVRNLHPVPDNVTNEEAVFTEPLAAAMQVLLQCKLDARSKVTVLGDGRLGLLVAQVVQRSGCKALLLGRHANKLQIADRLGIRTGMDAEYSTRRDQDVVIDCTGRAEGFERACQLVRPRGTVVMKTTVAAGKPTNLAPVVVDEITVLGSRCGPFRDALMALGQKQVDVTSLITRRMKLENAEAIFATGQEPDGLKVLVTF